jgi:hypothetical protein
VGANCEEQRQKTDWQGWPRASSLTRTSLGFLRMEACV